MEKIYTITFYPNPKKIPVVITDESYSLFGYRVYLSYLPLKNKLEVKVGCQSEECSIESLKKFIEEVNDMFIPEDKLTTYIRKGKLTITYKETIVENGITYFVNKKGKKYLSSECTLTKSGANSAPERSFYYSLYESVFSLNYEDRHLTNSSDEIEKLILFFNKLIDFLNENKTL